jgi:hypothetical protein
VSLSSQAAAPLPADQGREGPWGSTRLLVRAVARETTLARLGLGVVALHVLDDSFFQPQPGTSAGDHLVPGSSRPQSFSSLPGSTLDSVRACVHHWR